jgi:hypothetical protein
LQEQLTTVPEKRVPSQKVRTSALSKAIAPL